MDGVPAKIRNEGLPNTSLVPYRYTKPLYWEMVTK
jgi:hypothetical protein